MKRRVDSRSQATRFWERPSHGHRTHFHSSTRETAKHHTNGMRKGHGVTARANSHKEQRATCACSSGIWVATRRHARRRSNPCRRCMSPKQPCAAGGSRISESRSARCRDGGSARRFRVRSAHHMDRVRLRRARFDGRDEPAACDVSRKRRAANRAALSRCKPTAPDAQRMRSGEGEAYCEGACRHLGRDEGGPRSLWRQEPG